MNNQRGIAIITVLLALALAALICSEVVVRVYYSLNRSTSLFDLQQAEQYALGGEAWARQLLAEDYNNGKVNRAQLDHLEEAWAATGLKRSVDGAEIAVEINDLHACFNLNNLIDEEGGINGDNVALFGNMLNFLGLPVHYADFAARWASYDDDSEGRYNTDEYPYYAADTAFGSVQELMLLRDMLLTEYERLLPFVCVLPQATAININTAPEPVLASFFKGKNASQRLQQFLSRRQQQRFFQNVQDFYNIAGDESAGLEEALTVSSNYFRVQVQVTYQERTARLESTIFRDPGTGELSLLSRDWRARFEPTPPRETGNVSQFGETLHSDVDDADSDFDWEQGEPEFEPDDKQR